MVYKALKHVDSTQHVYTCVAIVSHIVIVIILEQTKEVYPDERPAAHPPDCTLPQWWCQFVSYVPCQFALIVELDKIMTSALMHIS